MTASNLVSDVESSVESFESWSVLYNGGLSLTNYSVTEYYPESSVTVSTSLAPDGSSQESYAEFGRTISTARFDSSDNQISQVAYNYDSQGRPFSMTDARNGTATSFYNSADQVVATLTPSPDAVQPGQLTTNILDTLGRVVQTIQPDGTSVTNVYFANGLLQETYGSRTYPVQYTYDYAGRMKTMTTWTNFATSGGAAVTTWNYDAYRGFLTNKAYADGKGPS